MKRPLVHVRWSLPMAAVISVAAACGDLSSLSSDAEGTGSTGASGLGGSSSNTVGSSGSGASSPQPLVYTPYCGDACLPGTGVHESCAAGGMGGAGGAGGAGGGGGGSTSDDCKLEFDGQVVNGVCSVSGTQAAGAPCLSAADCLPGHGCVDPGECRPYCCGDLEACPSEPDTVPTTYCELRTMAVMGTPVIGATIPVCVPVTPCELLNDASCGMGLTCTIVRNDGSTSCVVPGTGEDGDPCPCAPGHLCSTGSNTCKQLCRVGMDDCPPSAPSCQGGVTTPMGFGICVAN